MDHQELDAGTTYGMQLAKRSYPTELFCDNEV
jgi:hypothetical protein